MAMVTPDGYTVDTWLDTNVTLEIDSHGDLFVEWEKWRRGEPSDLEGRRERIRGSLWAAMALAKVGAVSVQYQHETIRNLKRLAPPATPHGWWTEAAIYVLGVADGVDGVFRGWHRTFTNDHAELNNPGRDRMIKVECVEHGLRLISRDDDLIAETRAAGGTAYLPEEFGATEITMEEAQAMFMDRMSATAHAYMVAAETGADRRARKAAVRDLVQGYRRVWSDAYEWPGAD